MTVADLGWPTIDFRDGSVLFFRSGETGEEIPIPEKAALALEKVREISKTGLTDF